MFRILVVEDDEKLNRVMCRYLSDAGYEAIGFLNADEAAEAFSGSLYDLVISDIMLPGTDGFAFVEDLRAADENLPVMFVSARDDFAAKQRGFRLGVDDYMTKPVDPDELVLRVGALLRRAGIARTKKLTVGNLTMDADGVTASVDGRDVPVTLREFRILYKLLSYPGKTFSRSRLMDEFWDMGTESGLRTVDVYVTRLRDKFSACDGFKIVTVHGLGYKAVLT